MHESNEHIQEINPIGASKTCACEDCSQSVAILIMIQQKESDAYIQEIEFIGAAFQDHDFFKKLLSFILSYISDPCTGGKRRIHPGRSSPLAPCAEPKTSGT